MSSSREGTLKFFSETARWRIHYPNGKWEELSSGCSVELKIEEHWVYSTVEHNGRGYYSTTPGTRLQEGLPARWA